MDLPCPDGLAARRPARAGRRAAGRAGLGRRGRALRRLSAAEPGPLADLGAVRALHEGVRRPRNGAAALPGGGAAATGGVRPPAAPRPRAEAAGPAGGGLRGLCPRPGPRPRQRLRPGRIARGTAAADSAAGRRPSRRGLRLRRLRPAGLRAARPGADRHPAGAAQPHRALPALRPPRHRGRRLRRGQRRLEADPARRVRAPGRPVAQRRRPGRARLGGRGVGAALDAVRARARRWNSRPAASWSPSAPPGGSRTTCCACARPRRGTACATCRWSTTASPRWCRSTAPPGLSAEFAGWFAGACLHADAMLAISDCTRDDVLRLRRRLLPDAADLPVAVLPLHAGPLLPAECRRRARAPRCRTAAPMCSSSPPSRAARTTCWSSTPGFP